jgi:IS5 family transposase
LLSDYEGEYVIADKSYDADPFRQATLDSGAEPVILPRDARKEQ